MSLLGPNGDLRDRPSIPLQIDYEIIFLSWLRGAVEKKFKAEYLLQLVLSEQSSSLTRSGFIVFLG